MKRMDLLDKFSKSIMDKQAMPKGYEDWDEERHERLLKLMYDYYKINDLETGLKHSEIFSLLYLNTENLLYDEIAERFYINIYTLDRYRQRYNKLAQSLISDMLEMPHPAKTVR